MREDAAQWLFDNWMARRSYAPLSGNFAVSSVNEAYEVQARLQALHIPQRGAIAGRKIALSSKAMQQMVGLDDPVAGAIFVGDVHQSGAKIALSNFVRLGLECELAMELAQDVPPQSALHSQQSAYDLITAVRPAFELIEDRAADYAQLDAHTLIADNAWCGGVILGARLEDWRILDLDDQPSQVQQTGHAVEDANTGAAEPLASLAWVLNHFSERGITLRQGEQIITGSAVRTRFPSAGEHFRYEVAGAAVEITVV